MLDLPMHGDNFSFLVMIHRPVSPLASDDEFSGAAELLDIMYVFTNFFVGMSGKIVSISMIVYKHQYYTVYNLSAAHH